MGWNDELTSVDRVRQHTAPDVLDAIDDDLVARIERLRGTDARTITSRLRELDDEWDIERTLIVNAATVASTGVAASALFGRRALVFPAVVLGFLLQHGLQGWCPPLAIFRRRNVRTRREIDLERYVLKVLRGDLDGDTTAVSAHDLLERAARNDPRPVAA